MSTILSRRALVGSAAGGAFGPLVIDAAMAQKKPMPLRDDAFKLAPQLVVLPKGGEAKFVVDAYVTVTCNICYEFIGQVAAPMLGDAGIKNTIWVFTLAPRNPAELAVATKFMSIEQGRRGEAFARIMHEGYKRLQKTGHVELNYRVVEKAITDYPKDATLKAADLDMALRLANNYFYRHLNRSDMPAVYANGKLVPYVRRGRQVADRSDFRKALRAQIG